MKQRMIHDLLVGMLMGHAYKHAPLITGAQVVKTCNNTMALGYMLPQRNFRKSSFKLSN